jgi:hypothetical protein
MPVAPPTLFIGSSKRAEPIASALRSRIKAEGTSINIMEWWVKGKVFQPGTETVAALLSACKKSDFAAILFTQDDLLHKGDKEYLAPRDNCVFEAGLFMDGLGPERCFILTSVKKHELPSDLQGLTYIALSGEPPDVNVSGACDAIVEDAAVQISDIIKVKKHREHRAPHMLISLEDLMENEQIHPLGNLRKGAVVVSSAQPLEQDYFFAGTVMKNMRAGVDYLYFLHADPNPEAVNFICELIGMISIALLLKGNLNPKLPADRKSVMQGRIDDVLQNLTEMQQRLSVYFLPYKVPLEFCVHNAGSSDFAQCYLRNSTESFVKWSKGKEAMEVGNELLSLRKPKGKSVIFRATEKYDLYAKAGLGRLMRVALTAGIEREFVPDLQARVKEVCFGEKPIQKVPGQDS